MWNSVLLGLVFSSFLVSRGQERFVKYGYKDWVQYEVGNSSIILSAGHGGLMEPSGMPDRQHGCLLNGECTYKYGCQPKNTSKCRVTTVTDSYTMPITYGMVKTLKSYGIFPHVITNSIKRTKVDMNRDIKQACGEVSECERLYKSYHGFIEEARASMKGRVGLYLDIHGQKHKENWTELGYTVTTSQLISGDYEDVRSSINHLKVRTGLPLKELFTGNASLGSMLYKLGYRAVPSPEFPTPKLGSYYSGGYNTKMYGSKYPGNCTDAIQIELPKALRFAGDVVIEKLSKDLATAVVEFMKKHGYGSADWKCGCPGLLCEVKGITILSLITMVLVMKVL